MYDITKDEVVKSCNMDIVEEIMGFPPGYTANAGPSIKLSEAEVRMVEG